MIDDLFASNTAFEPLPLEGADIQIMRCFDLGIPHARLAKELANEINWRSEMITVWGKTFLQPRLVAWFGDEGLDYTYSGIKLNPTPWTEQLSIIRNKIEEIASSQFNSVLLNYYRDNRDSMGFHSDNEPELGPYPTIASLSLGTTRTLIFKHRFKAAIKPVKIPLTSGSVLLMKGDTQKNWRHGIEKETRVCGPRINLTFRKIYPL